MSADLLSLVDEIKHILVSNGVTCVGKNIYCRFGVESYTAFFSLKRTIFHFVDEKFHVKFDLQNMKASYEEHIWSDVSREHLLDIITLYVS